MEALRFGQHVLGLQEIHALTASRICNSICKKRLTCERKQASPFTVEELRILHHLLNDQTRDKWDRLMAGMILMTTYSRSRWSDLQHGQRLIRDRDQFGHLAFLEVHSFEFKTRNSSAFRGTFLPAIAPAVGVTHDNWGEVWLDLRDEMMLEDSLDFPLMPAPKEDSQPSLRPVDTSEMGRWLKLLLGLTTEDINSMDRRLSSHSCKCTCLSYLSKFGASWDDRAVLGGHCMAHSSVMVYSRDAMSRPLLVLEGVLQKIRDREFFPDSSRSGRFASQTNPVQSTMLGRVAGPDTFERAEHVPLQESLAEVMAEFGDLEQTSDAAVTQEVKAEPFDDGLADGSDIEVISSSSDATTSSSDDEAGAVSNPARRLALPPKAPDGTKILQHQKTRMLHLMSVDHQRVFCCGRTVGSFHKPPGETRYDTPCCSGCWRHFR